ncbi:MAG: hypothetical protein ABSC01_00370 [Verrucomicrobiota bacterium]|jgi:hypothetical protein
MNFRPVAFRMPLLAGALAAVFLSAAAQNGAPPSSKAIIFSAPAGENAASNAPSLSPRLSDRPDFANELRAPVSVFDAQGPTPPLPAPSRAPMLSSAEAQRLQKMLDERENWALMTPEEILGVDTSRNTLRTPEQEAADNQKNLTVVERFLERQRQSHTAVTNGYYSGNFSSGRDFSRNQGGLTNGSPSDPARIGLPAAAQILDRFFNNTPANNQFAGQNENRSAGWFTSLGLPPQPAAPTPEQLAERERFSQLLNPGSYSDTTAKSAPGGKFLSSLQPFSDTTPNQTPMVNPVGASFAPLNSGIGRPAGLTPLPGITGPTNWQSSTAPPAWAPQPPPWLSQTPQPFTMPQRKF